MQTLVLDPIIPIFPFSEVHIVESVWWCTRAPIGGSSTLYEAEALCGERGYLLLEKRLRVAGSKALS